MSRLSRTTSLSYHLEFDKKFSKKVFLTPEIPPGVYEFPSGSFSDVSFSICPGDSSVLPPGIGIDEVDISELFPTSSSSFFKSCFCVSPSSFF